MLSDIAGTLDPTQGLMDITILYAGAQSPVVLSIWSA